MLGVFQLESGESRSGSSMSLSKPLPAIPSGRQSADLGIGHTSTALAPSGYAPGKPFPARYTPTMGNTSKSGEISRYFFRLLQKNSLMLYIIV